MNSESPEKKIQEFIRKNLWYVPSKEQITHTFKVGQLKSYYTIYITKALMYKVRFYQSALVSEIKKEDFTAERKEKVKNNSAQFFLEMEDGDIGIYETKYITEKTSWSQPDINNHHLILEILK